MSMAVRAGAGLTGLVVTTVLCACTTGDPAATPSPRPSASANPDSASIAPQVTESLAVLETPGTGRVVENLRARAGYWASTVGAADDEGALDISVSCVGGGHLAIAYRGTSSADATLSAPCYGAVSHHRDEAVPPGAIHITIQPAGAQQWSVLIARGTQAAD